MILFYQGAFPLPPQPAYKILFNFSEHGGRHINFLMMLRIEGRGGVGSRGYWISELKILAYFGTLWSHLVDIIHIQTIHSILLIIIHQVNLRNKFCHNSSQTGKNFICFRNLNSYLYSIFTKYPTSTDNQFWDKSPLWEVHVCLSGSRTIFQQIELEIDLYFSHS